MELQGKIISILPVQSGVSKSTGKEWKSMTFVIETNETYPRKIAIDLFGEERITSNPIALDQVVTASVDIESREVGGRWFTSVRAWKVAQGTESAPAAAPIAQQQSQNATTLPLKENPQVKKLQEAVNANVDDQQGLPF